ncbi:MAG: Gfo/Idh/MocA family oxidoreductase [Acidobacteria bacterium]|nr:Gfo/Idh/MocA family oxidoreductase [Acidobacteriota bacterium]
MKGSRRSFLRTSGSLCLTSPLLASRAEAKTAPGNNAKKIRIGIIGVGGRGTGFLKASLQMGAVDVPALCDIRPEAVQQGADLVQKSLGYKPEAYTKGPTDYKRMVVRDDIDAVFVTTPTVWHGPMAVDSLHAHKWVFSEVPACNTLEEGWEIVKAAEQSNAGYFLAENYCFMRDNMMVLNMVEKGIFGTLTFAECGYIHEARTLQFNEDGSLTWRGELNSSKTLIGNTYPTHSLGPVSQWLGITRGDRLTHCTSMMSRSATFREYATQRFGPNSTGAKASWNGDTCNTLIQTESGMVIHLRFDIASPRPHNLTFYTLQGTGASYDDEAGMYIDGKSNGWESISGYYAQYDHPYWLKHSEQAKSAGHGGGDYFILQHFYRCIRENSTPGIDVYDAVTWSSLIPLSAKSILEKAAPQEIPDYTRGKWKVRRRFEWSKA